MRSTQAPLSSNPNRVFSSSENFSEHCQFLAPSAGNTFLMGILILITSFRSLNRTLNPILLILIVVSARKEDYLSQTISVGLHSHIQFQNWKYDNSSRLTTSQQDFITIYNMMHDQGCNSPVIKWNFLIEFTVTAPGLGGREPVF